MSSQLTETHIAILSCLSRSKQPLTATEIESLSSAGVEVRGIILLTQLVELKLRGYLNTGRRRVKDKKYTTFALSPTGKAVLESLG